MLSARVHSRHHQHLRDVPVTGPAGDLHILLLKRRYTCAENACPRRTFTQTSEQLPARARLTTRLRSALLEAVVEGKRVVAEVAATHGVSW